LNHFSYYTNSKELEIVCYYDSNIKEQTVGEGTTVDVPETLYNQHKLEFHDIFEKLNGHFKTGIYYKGWGKQNYMHTFPMPNVSIHFNAVKLQNLLQELNKDRVKFIDKNVEHKDIDADFILDCSGKPKTNEAFNKAKYIPVNSVVVAQCQWEVPKFYYTICEAYKNGWIFGIPLQDRISFGYLYNENLNDKNFIEQELKEYIDGFNLKVNQVNYLSFGNYYRKVNYFKRGAFNGNASFFLEPMEATSIATIDDINRNVYDLLFEINTLKNINKKYNEWFKQVQDVITLHYLAGSKYDTDFWKFAKELAFDCVENKSDLYKQIIKNLDNEHFDFNGNYGTWGMHSFRQNVSGLGISNLL
jgi:tryptophan 7-halogenase